MPQAPAYNRSTPFASDERDNVGGRSTVRTDRVDAELDAISTSINALRGNQELNQRDDGEIRDKRVKLHTLAGDVLSLMLVANGATPRGSWATATSYALRDLVVSSGNTYLCGIAHTSGTFATDLAAGRWLLSSLGSNPAASGIPFTPAGGIAATNVQAAIEELQIDAAAAAAAALQPADLAGTGSSQGTSLIGWLRAAAGAVVTTLKSWLGWQEISAFEFMTTAQIANFQTGTQTLDLAVPLQAWINACASQGLVGRLPKGNGKTTVPLALPSGVTIRGHGISSALTAWGCDLFTVAAGGEHVVVEDLAGYSASAVGAGDPRLYAAVFCNGTLANNVNYVTLRNLYLQGWADGINWRYTWNSRAENVTTINSNNGVVVGGQSVNNTITGCRLVSNSGNASISCAQIASDVPEGLMVSDTLMASGSFGVLVTGGFLSMQINNCVIDLVTNIAVQTTDCKDLRISNSWLFGASGCVNLLALGVNSVQGVSLIGNGMTATNVSAQLIAQRGANIGLAVIGNRLTLSASQQGIYLDGQAATIDGNHFASTSGASSIAINSGASTHRIGKNTGVVTIGGGTGVFGTPEYTEGDWTVTDQSGAGLTITSNGQARYIKHGKLVTCTLDITYPATANGSTARLSLPFQTENGASFAGCVGFQQTATFVVEALATSNAADFRLWRPATQAYATNADLSGARFIISFTYRANA